MAHKTQLTILTLQKELRKEIEAITQDMLLKQPNSKDLIRLRAFSQNLPIPHKLTPEMLPSGDTDIPEEESEYGIEYPFPWAMVKLEEGNIPEPGADQKVNVIIVLGIFDDSQENKGHETIVLVIERIMERFLKNPLLSGQFTLVPIDNNHLVQWSLQDEDTYPYYYGAIAMAFQTPGFQREDYYGFA